MTSLIIVGAKTINVRKDQTHNLRNLPRLRLLSPDSIPFEISRERIEKPVLITIINSDCEHCINQVDQLMDQQSILTHIEILLISSEDPDKLKVFKERHLAESATIRLMHIPADDVWHFFGSVSTPHSFAYTKEGFLLNEFRGEVSVATLIKPFDNEHTKLPE